MFMNKWTNGISLIELNFQEKIIFIVTINMEDITDLDDNHTKRFCKDFKIKNFGECQDLYLKSDTFEVVDFFEKFRKMCLEIYEQDLAIIFSVPGLV